MGGGRRPVYPAAASAVALTGTVTSGSQDSANNLSFSYTSPGDVDLLVVVVAYWDVNNITIGDLDHSGIASVTFNGDALTFVQNSAETGAPGFLTEIWQRVAPDVSTTANVVITYAGASGTPIAGVAVGIKGANQTTPLANATQNATTGPGTGPSVSISSATDNLVIDGIWVDDDSTNLTAGAGQTEQAEVTVTGWGKLAVSTEAGAASVTMSWTTPNATWAHIGASIQKP